VAIRSVIAASLHGRWPAPRLRTLYRLRLIRPLPLATGRWFGTPDGWRITSMAWHDEA
jgi:hypothetical protein